MDRIRIGKTVHLKMEITTMQLYVSEIFFSIQGESIYCGRPCVFVRLSGCNLRCTYCDTTYAYGQTKALYIEEILAKVAAYPCALVEITGGEPLIQENTRILVDQLLEKGYEVLLETNGSQDIGTVNPGCIKIVDIKCPTSGEEKKNDWENLKKLKTTDQVKFVIGDRTDYDYAKNVLDLIDKEFPPGNILFSPVFSHMNAAALARWILEDGLNVRLHLQLHKTIWPEKERGV